MPPVQVKLLDKINQVNQNTRSPYQLAFASELLILTYPFISWTNPYEIAVLSGMLKAQVERALSDLDFDTLFSLFVNQELWENETIQQMFSRWVPQSLNQEFSKDKLVGKTVDTNIFKLFLLICKHTKFLSA